MKCLFIGGPKAGMVREMDHCPPFINIPVFPQTQAKFNHYPLEPEPCTVEHAVYARDCAHDKSGTRHTVYIYGDEDPLIQLMRFYVEGHK